MMPVKITDYATFSKSHPAIAQTIEEKFPELNGETSFTLTPQMLQQLPAHMVEQMTNPEASKAKREAALTRLEQYWEKEKGLINNQHNADMVAEGVRQLNQGLTADSVDRAVIIQRELGKLQWKALPPAPAASAQANAAVPPAAPVAPPEPRRLDNGELELPLNADEWTMRKASKVQLLDLSARRKEGRQRPAGWVGSSF
jgi:hypothetical protein